MKLPNNEMEYIPYKCYRCLKTPITNNTYTLCENCIKEYNKTWHWKITRTNTWPKDLVSGRPIRLFGIYLFSILKIANPNYEWACSESYDPGNCRCKKHLRCHCSDTEIPHLHQDGKIYK